MDTPVMTPCWNAKKFAACNNCRRAHPTPEDRVAMLKCWLSGWRPDAYGQCDGLLPRGEKP